LKVFRGPSESEKDSELAGVRSFSKLGFERGLDVVLWTIPRDSMPGFVKYEAADFK